MFGSCQSKTERVKLWVQIKKRLFKHTSASRNSRPLPVVQGNVVVNKCLGFYFFPRFAPGRTFHSQSHCSGVSWEQLSLSSSDDVYSGGLTFCPQLLLMKKLAFQILPFSRHRMAGRKTLIYKCWPLPCISNWHCNCSNNRT